MKKSLLILFLVLTIMTLASCQKKGSYTYSDNDPIILEVDSETIKILQLTDLHYAYGISHRDHQTDSLIRDLANSDQYDLIVLTGDVVMSPQAPRLFRQLVQKMEALKIPWTFVFGNHESDHHHLQKLLDQTKDTEYLLFKTGPEIEDGGVGNFKITFTYENNPLYHAYFLDSKDEVPNDPEADGIYDYLSVAQVQWYETSVQNDTHDSIAFMHMPLRQYIEVGDDYDGVFKEGKVYAQGKDTGFFDAMVTYNRTKGVFVGHDHLNDFSFTHTGILLAYGRNSGYSAYGYLDRGGRHIEINSGVLSTRVVLHKEVRP
ncbi:MAG: metallophosphoesterase [Acholeplasmataceae bacterium]|nr:metallophosphoesterase [Acholeplasmataceae bacterium]